MGVKGRRKVELTHTPLCYQDMQQDLEQLTKELRQVNLQQFIQQTGTKVTVLPAEPGDPPAPGSPPGPGDPPDPPAPGHSIGDLFTLLLFVYLPVWAKPPGSARLLQSLGRTYQH